MSGARTCAQPRPAGDGEQRPLVHRSRCSPRLMPGVRLQFILNLKTNKGSGIIIRLALLVREGSVKP
jgi:hypothetical protein